MIRLIQRRLIIPRGDTGTFTVPLLASTSQGDAAVLTIFDEMTEKIIYQKLMEVNEETLTVSFTHADTVNLPVGDYVWDIKFYNNPTIADNKVIDGTEVNSYYAAFKLPVCEIKQTGDALLTADDAPTTTIEPNSLNVLLAASEAATIAKQSAEANAAITAENMAQAVEAANNAEQYATDLWSAVEQADASATAAGNSAISANSSANRAQSYSTLAMNAYSNASAASTAAQNARDRAQASVVDANNAAVAAQTSATQASNSATSAEETLAEMTSLVQSIPTNVSEFENDAGYITAAALPTKVSDLTNDAGYLTTHQDISGKANSADLAAVATSGSYNDLTNKPTIPTNTSQLTNNSNFAVDANYIHTDNNYTTADKNKLSGIAAGAEVNVKSDWNASTGDAEILNKPTKLSQFTNDAGYITGFTETDPTVPEWAKNPTKPTYTAAEVGAPTVAEMQAAIANIKGMDIHICGSSEYNSETGVPTVSNPDDTTFYLVPGGEGSNLFIEWAYVNNAWERFGSADVDLSNYATKSEVTVSDVQINSNSILNNKVANIPVLSDSNLGVCKIDPQFGINANAAGRLYIQTATSTQIKDGLYAYKSIAPSNQHAATFYGLAKAAGADMASSENAVGTYTDAAKTAIRAMLDVPSTDDITVTDVQIGDTSIVSNGIATIPVATSSTPGLVQINGGGLAFLQENVGGQLVTTNIIGIVPATSSQIKQASSTIAPIAASNAYRAAFYGLAKAAGDTTQASSSNAIGTYTTQAKTAIRAMLDAPAVSDIPDVPVTDVQIGGTSIVASGVANVPIAALNVLGAVSISEDYGTTIASGSTTLRISKATDALVKAGEQIFRPIVASNQHLSVFYGLAKAAGADEKDSTLAAGQYTATAKTAIQQMLGVPSVEYVDTAVSNLISIQTTEPDDEDTKIWINNEDSTSVQIPTVSEMETALAAKVSDVQFNGTSIVANGIANIPPTGTNVKGYCSVDPTYGISAIDTGRLYLSQATNSQVKAGTYSYRAIVPANQHMATFYGLAAAAGDNTQSGSSNAVGTYTNEASTAIQKMLKIYEAPWELIDEDTFTNATEADYIISTDANGQAFSLTDAIVILWVPTQETAATIADYGRVYFYQGTTNIRTAYLANTTSKTITANSVVNVAIAKLTQSHNLMDVEYYEWNATASHVNTRRTLTQQSDQVGTPFSIGSGYVDSIKIGKITGTMGYRLLGRRKQN